MRAEGHRLIASTITILLTAVPALAARDVVPVPSGPPPLPAAPARAPEGPPDAAGPDLYGRVILEDGGVLEGYLRWDRNETTVHDVLDGLRRPTDEGLRLRRELAQRSPEDLRRSVDLFGVRVTWQEEEPETWIDTGVRFGWVSRIVPDGSSAMVELSTGDVIEVRASSTDLGPAFRGLEVETPAGEVQSVEWARIVEVRLAPAPESAMPSRVRLHGTVRTRDDAAFTGWIAWDADEVYAEDVLDGAERTVAFGDIAEIERVDPGVRVSTASGESLRLSGTDDVGDGTGGIHVSDPGLGSVVVPWDAFGSVRFHRPTADPGPLDGEGELRGSIETGSGAVHRGRIVWDLDEDSGWHVLDGDVGDVRVSIEFSRIVRITRAEDGEGAMVTLRDGRVLRVDGSTDVGPSNHGMAVIDASGAEQIVEWADFRSLELSGAR